ncbi:hypothetical protein T265_07020 [Opisthorchis viverrini]|uniref:Uncharacterized protein n=1 Tax=Opisthorchis viverrini TaxID=6198 RepID=A0A074ZE62_OPIVI|nr:hypothetical protein T265_07020 [Opisthorchis viverrini]KER25561.1 hypothetical protein T265_07020 [Opisthorchis viverrini]
MGPECDPTVFFARLQHSRVQCAATYPLPQIIGERNCGSYNQCTTSTRFLQLTMMMMMTSDGSHFMYLRSSGNREAAEAGYAGMGILLIGYPSDFSTERAKQFLTLFYNALKAQISLWLSGEVD